jgi:hypothetical protein
MASSWRRALRSGVPVAAVAAGLAFASGCGDDDDGGEPQSVAIEATGSKGDVTYEVPAEASAGAAEIELTNSSDSDGVSGQMVYTAEDHSDQEVLGELQKATRGQPVADWFQGGGGVGTVPPGESATVTQDLQEGTYYVVGEDRPQTPLTKITVSGEGDELPDADGTVTAAEYSFSSDGLPSGENTIELDNSGAQWHHFIASELKEGATIEQAKTYLQSEGQGGGPSPFTNDLDAGNAIESTVLEGGTSQQLEVNLQPGRYAFFCFIGDKQGGPPHVVKGMVSEVTVED